MSTGATIQELQNEVTALKEKLDLREALADANQGAEAQGERFWLLKEFVRKPINNAQKQGMIQHDDKIESDFQECTRDGTPLTEPAKPAATAGEPTE